MRRTLLGRPWARRPPVAPLANPWLQAAVGLLLGTVTAVLAARSPLLAAAGVVVVVAAALLWHWPRLAVVLGVGLLLVDGALRKWFLPGLQELLYFAKDGILALLVVRWLFVPEPRGRAVLRFGPGWALLVALLVGWFLLELFNPRSPSLALYLFGLRTYLLPLALIGILPSFLDRVASARLLRLLVWAVVPLGILAAIQALLPPEHVLNRYVHSVERVAVVGGGAEATVRVTATFSYVTGYASYLWVVALLAPYVVRSQLRNRGGWWRLGILEAWILAQLVLTGSRAPLALAVTALPLVSWPLWRHGRAAELGRVVVGVALGGMLLGVLFREPLERFTERVETTADAGERLENLILGPFTAVPEAGLMGWGPATTHQSRAQLLRRAGDWGLLPPAPEEEPTRVVLELGGVGAVIWYLVRLGLIVTAWRWWRLALRRGDLEAALLHGAVAVLSLQSLATQLVTNVYLYYFWAFAYGCARLWVPRATSAPPLEAQRYQSA